MGGGVQCSDICAQQDADTNIRRSDAVRGALGVKPDVSHCTHSECYAPLSRKLDNRTTRCFFVGYKCDGGGRRVWDPERRVVGEFRRCFLCFEDSLPSPTLNVLPPRPVDEDESVTRPVFDHSIKPTTPLDAANAPTLSPLSATTPTPLPGVTRQPVSAPTPHRRITIRLPGRGMNRSAASTARVQNEPADIDEDEEDEHANDGSDEDADSPARPIHDVSYVPSSPSKSMRSGLIRNGGGGGNSAMLDEGAHPPIAFSAGLPGGIQLSQLPDPRSVGTQMDGRLLWTRRWRTSSRMASIN